MSERVSVWVEFSMLGYGAVAQWGRLAPSSEGAVLPGGEHEAPADYWLGLYLRAHPDDRPEIEALAIAYLERWRRRPEPPSEGETLVELKTRIVKTGAGWTPQEVALAVRCTPTFVRNVRTEFDRNPETGKVEGSLEHARALLTQGLSLRQVAILTGIPKSTLHDAMKAAA
jgi:hypothetical protein